VSGTSLRVALTGGIGSGKSTVGRLLADLGAQVIDADQLAREVVAAGTVGLAAVVAEFGADYLQPDGALDRRRMAELVFADPQARRRLERIVHPAVAERFAARAAAAPAGAVVVYEVPLLVEAARAPDFDVVVVVEAPEPVRLARLAARGLSAEEASARMQAQAGAQARLASADLVIPNDGDLARLEREVRRVWQLLRAWGSDSDVQAELGQEMGE
jgi:dephospho-CoA kinase